MRSTTARTILDGMPAPLVVVYPPDEDGGRRVRAAGEILGRAYSLGDLVEFMRRAGLDDWDDSDARTSGLIEWRGGGPDDWPRGPGLAGAT